MTPSLHLDGGEAVFPEDPMLSTKYKKLLRDERGVTMIEYGIAIVLAVVVGTAGLLALGAQIDGNMKSAATEMVVSEEN